MIGRSQSRIEGVDKVTGRARYSGDVRLPGLCYARVLRSPLPRARVLRVDTSRAEALPGVRAVLCHDSVPPIRWYDDSALFDDEVRFAGDEVAAVAADTEAIADDALRIRVSMSEMGSVIVISKPHQLDFVIPGISPLCAISRKHSRQSPKRLYTARGRPQRLHRV
jgi:xanthine dehydrogenase molybdopterin-binding subunit B